MSRHGYSDELDPLELGRWRAQIASATRGNRGQKFFRALVAALDAMPDKRLIKGKLEDGDGLVCGLGCLAKVYGFNLSTISTHDWETLGKVFDIAPQLAQEVMYVNDDDWRSPTPEQRWKMVRLWAARQIRVRPDEVQESVQ